MFRVNSGKGSYSKKGTTLIELVVALTLMAIFAVACISLINPIERTYQNTEKIARAQLLADTVVDAIRKECDDVKYDDKSSVWIASGNFEADSDDAVLFSGPDSIKADEGSVLILKKNRTYCEAIYSCFPISEQNKTDVINNAIDGVSSEHAVTKLFDGGGESLEKGIVHFGYYEAVEDEDGIYPSKSYDYTNPVPAGTYDEFSVKLTFKNIGYKESKYPSYVECRVEIYEGDYTDAAVIVNGPVYFRDATLCFSANGSAPGSSYQATPVPADYQNINVTVVWEDDDNKRNLRPDSVTLYLEVNGTQKGTGILPSDEETYTFANIDPSATVKVYQDTLPDYTTKITRTAEGDFIVTNTVKVNRVKLLPGPSIKKLLDSGIREVIFADAETYKNKLKNRSYDEVALNEEGEITDDYKLFIVGNKAYFISEDGNFVANENCDQMFDGFSYLKEFSGLDRIDTSNTETMDRMFQNCGTDGDTDFTIDISGFSFASCRNINRMFYNDYWNTNLTEITFPEGKKDFSGMTQMDAVFSKCYALENLNNFNDLYCPDLTYVKNVFYNCTSLSELDLSNFYSPKLSSSSNIFYHCSFDKLILDNWNLSEVETLPYYWENISKMDKLYLNNWDISSVTNMRNYFFQKSLLKEIYLNNCKTDELLTIEGLFYECKNLEIIDMTRFVGSNCTSLRGTFEKCPKLATIEMNEWDTSGITSMYHEFYQSNVGNGGTLDISGYKFDSVTDMQEMFTYSGYSKILLPEHSEENPLVFPVADNVMDLFKGCTELTDVDFNNVSFPKATTASGIFDSCLGYTSIELNNLSFPSATRVGYFFQNCDNATTITLNDIDFSGAENADGFFKSCDKLEKVKFTNVNMKTCSSWVEFFLNTPVITEIDLQKINFDSALGLGFLTANSVKKLSISEAELNGVTSLAEWQKSKRNLEEVSLSDINMESCTTMIKMFNECQSLSKVTISNLKSPAVLSTANAFSYCYSLASLSLSSWDTSKVTDMSYMFYNCSVAEGPASGVSGNDTDVVLDVSELNFNSVTTFREMFGAKNQNKDFIDTIILPEGEKAVAVNVTDTYYMFRFRTSLSSIENLGDLQLSGEKLTNICAMFSRVNVTELDLRGIDLTGFTGDGTWFMDNCGKLKTVYVLPGTDWSTLSFNSSNMFTNCYKLVGGNDTTYNGGKLNKSYAKVDTEGNPGYFTAKAKEAD